MTDKRKSTENLCYRYNTILTNYTPLSFFHERTKLGQLIPAIYRGKNDYFPSALN